MVTVFPWRGFAQMRYGNEQSDITLAVRLGKSNPMVQSKKLTTVIP